MSYYFFTSLFLGVCVYTARRALILINRGEGALALPAWCLQSNTPILISGIVVFGAFLCFISHLFEWGLFWAIVQFLEISLGSIIAYSFIRSNTLFNLIYIFSPFYVIAILGSYWGLWYL